MKASVQKQKFLQGAGILTVGILLNKIISAVYKLPLTRLIGKEAVGHFSVAYNIYELMMVIAAAGLPVALSRLISEASARGERRQMQRIFRVSLVVFLTIGLVGGAGLLLFSRQIAARMNDTAADAALRMLAPAIFFFCLFCAFRGYYQGQQYMTPTSVSQIVEAFCKLGVGLGAVLVAIRMGLGPGASAACAVMGVSAGAGLSCVYLILVYRRNRVVLRPGAADGPVLSRGQTLARLFRVAVPITLGAAGLQIFKLFGTKEILRQLQGPIGLNQAAAVELFGVYSLAVSLFQMPGTVVQPLGVSLVAGVTERITVGDDAGRRRLEESALRMTALIAMPCGVGLAVLARPIPALLFGYEGSMLNAAATLLRILGPASILYCFLVVTNALLQARGQVMAPFYHTLIGGAVYLLLCKVLVPIPSLHIYGAALATASYSLLIPGLNLLAIRRGRAEAPRLLRQLWRPAAASLGMGVITWAIQRLSGTILLSLPAAAAVYAGLIFVLRAVTREDCELLPHGAAIARLLRLEPGADEKAIRPDGRD